MPMPENPLEWGVKAFRDNRAVEYRRYRDYINGNQPLMFAMDKFQRAFGRLFDPFAYNRCGTVVDAHADRLHVVGFGSDDGDDENPLAQDAQDLWDRAGMEIYEGALEADSTGLGDAHLLVQVHPESGEVQMWPQDPECIRVHYDTERPGVRDLAAKMWRDEDTERMHLNLYFQDRIEKYRTTNKAHSIPSSWRAFEPYQPEGDTEWPVRLRVTDTVPIFSIHNNGRINRYGTSELQDVLALQDAMNLSLAGQMVAEQFVAAPQWVLLNYALDPDNAEATTMLQGLAAGIGQMAVIPPNGKDEAEPKIAEFSAADMKQFDLIAEKWDIRIARVSRVPIHYITGETKAESGRAKRLDEAPFVAKIVDRQRERGPVYANAVSYGLRLQGRDVEPGAIRVNWEPATPMSEEDMWDLAAAKAAAGWPLKAIAREMGRDPDEIETIMQEIREEREAAMIDLGTFEGVNEDETEGVA